MTAKPGGTVTSLHVAVTIEHQTLTPAMQSSPEAVLVRRLAALIDATSTAGEAARLSQEFRAANEALAEAVLRAGKRGDAVDALAERRAARRKPATANPGRAAKGRK